MSYRALIITALTAVFVTAANADPIDPCSLLSGAEMAELGLSKESVSSRESQPGGVQACKYQFQSAGTGSDGMVSIILSQAEPDRVRQVRVLQAKAQEESTPMQQQARGEYFQDKVMCKVVLVSQQETSQCLGTSEQSVVALAVSRPNLTSEVSYPALQLRIIATLVSRVTSKGG
ncbi:hypothetical protein SAMN05216344_105138 [Polaromonas sp. OV174]|uniref:hypothetical protein n=1 Tax=Polaromonas sp. OV174 TaxID=1855300 RepID=UPI0008E54463|nr:hypothetical protein [Polaromonas sp. OV174]SFB91534.1 hypothetical protein SAMN05216344_105138 [Polaromonas sp. OV174]